MIIGGRAARRGLYDPVTNLPAMTWSCEVRNVSIQIAFGVNEE